MIKNRIDADLKSAMLAREAATVTTLRGLKSALLYAEVSAGSREQGLSDDEAIAVLQKEAKKRIESAELYRKGGSPDRAEAEEVELEVIQRYLPKQLDEAAITELVDAVCEELGISQPTKQDMGRLIAAVKQKAGAAADGALVARVVAVRIAAQ